MHCFERIYMHCFESRSPHGQICWKDKENAHVKPILRDTRGY